MGQGRPRHLGCPRKSCYLSMKIAIDARTYSWTGIGRYTRNLLNEFSRLDHAHRFTVLMRSEDAQKLTDDDRWQKQPERFMIHIVEGSYYSWREQVIFWRQIARLPVDLTHFTHFNVPLLFRRPFVVTIHDITRFIFPGQVQRGLIHQLVYEYIFQQTLARAQAAICVSQTTADELTHLPVRVPALAPVIYEGVESSFFAPISSNDRHQLRQVLKTTAPYLLFVGVWMSHKNLNRLLEAFAQIRARYPELHLVITGTAHPGYLEVSDIAAHYGVAQAIHLPGFIDHALLPALYAESKVFLFPSLYEGFGLPPLEAAACGTPVIASNVASIPEIMDGAATLINPEYTADMVNAVERILSDEAWRRQRTVRAREHVQQFTWKSCAQKTIELYERVGKR